jgi:hypothetical protein
LGIYPDFWPQIEVILGEQMICKYEELPTLNKILSRYIEVMGGRDAIIKLKTRVCEGRFVDGLSWQEPQIKSYALKAYAKIPDKWVTLIQTTK